MANIEFKRGMTNAEHATRGDLMEFLSSHNCPTYAKLLSLMDLQIMPSSIQSGPWSAFMLPDKGIIVLNSDFINNSANSVELIVAVLKHEILHEWRDHEKRLIDKLAKEKGISPEDVMNHIDEIKKDLYKNDLFNIAADLEIYDVAYDDVDKLLLKKIVIGDQVVSGLSMEDTPRWKNWANLPMEDMYDKLRDLDARTVNGAFDPNTGTFIAVVGDTGVVYGR